jgi:hypothetical protein
MIKVQPTTSDRKKTMPRSLLLVLLLLLLFVLVFLVVDYDSISLLENSGKGDVISKNLHAVNITTNQTNVPRSSSTIMTIIPREESNDDNHTTRDFVNSVTSLSVNMNKVCPAVFCDDGNNKPPGLAREASLCNRTHPSCSLLVNHQYGRGEGNLLVDVFAEKSFIFSPNDTSVLFDCGDDAVLEAKNSVIPWVRTECR